MLDNNKLTVLLNELDQCREDDRGSISLMLQVIAAGIAALAVVFALGTSDEGIAAQSPEWIFPVFAVGIVIAVFSYATSLGIKMSLRYHYMRFLENEIRTLVEMGSDYYGWNEVASPIITLNVHHIKSSWTVKHFASLIGGVLAALAVCLMLGVYFFLDKNPAFGALALALVLPFLILFLSNFSGTSSSEEMYNTALIIAAQKRSQVKQDKGALGESSGSDDLKSEKSSRARSAMSKLIIYLIYPRPKDALKILFILFGSLLGTVFSGFSLDDPSSWLHAVTAFLVSFLIFDFLGYQARYQWNDVRGYVEDEHNPEARKRARLPHIPDNSRLAPKLSLAIACYRLLLALMLCWCNPLGAGCQLFVCLVAIFVIAAIYEFARSKKACPTLVLLFLVSLGYPLRIFVGIWAACPFLLNMLSFMPDTLELVSVVIASVFFGIVFVGLTWALEGCDFHLGSKKGAYHKRHVDALALKLPGVFSDPYPLKEVRPVFAIWNVSMFLSVIVMSIPLVYFAPYLWLGIFACFLFLILFFCMVLLPAPNPDFAYIAACILLIVGGILCALVWFPQNDLTSRGSDLWCLTAIGLAVYLVIYTGFRNSNYKEMNDSLDNIKKAIAGGGTALLAVLVGKETSNFLMPKTKKKK